jgi:hypothetical protein
MGADGSKKWLRFPKLGGETSDYVTISVHIELILRFFRGIS